jgi:hypothetical protein
MKLAIAIATAFFAISCDAQTFNREQMRDLYLKFRYSKEGRDSIIKIVEKQKKPSAIECSYTGIFCAYNIKLVEGNWAKLKLLMKAREYLNDGVRLAPNDPETHYLRFAFEHHLPSFLGLNKHITDDLNFIFNHVNFLDNNNELKKMAFEFLLRTQRCNHAQNEMMSKELLQISTMK